MPQMLILLKIIPSKKSLVCAMMHLVSATMHLQPMMIIYPYQWLVDNNVDRTQEIFGHNIFTNRNLTFEPNINIATPSNYKLGPGDEVIIDVWGASETTIRPDHLS